MQAVNELPPDAKRARIQQLHLAATVRPGVASATYPGGGEAVAGPEMRGSIPQRDAALQCTCCRCQRCEGAYHNVLPCCMHVEGGCQAKNIGKHSTTVGLDSCTACMRDLGSV